MISEIDIYHQLGKRITYLRKKKGLSSLQLAINADINKNYLNDLENGRRNPSLMILRNADEGLSSTLTLYNVPGIFNTIESVPKKLASLLASKVALIITTFVFHFLYINLHQAIRVSILRFHS